MFDFAQARTNMVDSQLRPNGITDGRILLAYETIERGDFVPESMRSVAYMDGDVALGGGRNLVSPMAFAKMLNAAEIKPNDKVLEIGAATGFGAAVLSQLAGQVVAVEADAALMAAARENLTNKVNVSLSENNLTEGFAKGGPYDVILISGQVENVPEGLFSQLSEGGRLIAAIGSGRVARCCVWTRSGANHTQRYLFDLSIATLAGFGKPAVGFAF